VHHPAMAITRRRRILIAALAVVGILFVYSPSGPTRDNVFRSFLLDNPSIASVVRMSFEIVGRESEFQDWLFFGSSKPPQTRPENWFGP
jgi:hypothetical protein